MPPCRLRRLGAEDRRLAGAFRRGVRAAPDREDRRVPAGVDTASDVLDLDSEEAVALDRLPLQLRVREVAVSAG